MGRRIQSVFLLCLFLFSGVVWAEELPDESADQNLQGQLEASGAGELTSQVPDQTQEILEQLDLKELDYRILLSLTPEQIWQVCKAAFSKMIRAPLLLLGMLVAVILLCAAMDALKIGFNAKGLEKIFNGVAVLCLITIVLEPVTDCIQKASQAI